MKPVQWRCADRVLRIERVPLIMGILNVTPDSFYDGGRFLGPEEAIAQAACKAATKARDRLSLAELERLVVQLAGTEMPYTCPHGRPVMITLPHAEIERRFGRRA